MQEGLRTKRWRNARQDEGSMRRLSSLICSRPFASAVKYAKIDVMIMTPCFRPLKIALLSVTMLTLSGSAAYAQPSGETFDSYMASVAAKAQREGVSQATISRMLTGLTPSDTVIALDSRQPGRQTTPPAMSGYLAKHLGAGIVQRGKAKYAELSGFLPSIERRYGVPASILFAIWGHETNFGAYTGDFDLNRSLATLAWEGRRRDLFEGELIALLKMVDEGVPPSSLKGSWAGAFGYPQFLPSVYLRLAVDGDGDGRRDLFDSADAIASIANYFRDAGWRTGEPWGVAAAVPSGFAIANYANRLNPPSCDKVYARHSQWKSIAEWRQLGVKPLAPVADNVQATLFQPDGAGSPAWLLTGNYRVILQYNCSNYYALSVGLLSDGIKGN